MSLPKISRKWHGIVEAHYMSGRVILHRKYDAVLIQKILKCSKAIPTPKPVKYEPKSLLILAGEVLKPYLTNEFLSANIELFKSNSGLFNSLIGSYCFHIYARNARVFSVYIKNSENSQNSETCNLESMYMRKCKFEYEYGWMRDTPHEFNYTMCHMAKRYPRPSYYQIPESICDMLRHHHSAGVGKTLASLYLNSRLITDQSIQLGY